MAKQNKKISIDSKQWSLFDVMDRVQAERKMKSSGRRPGQGELNIQNRLRLALCRAIKGCSLSRWEIAGQMSDLLDVEISKNQLDSWTAESKEGYRFPAEYLAAFCCAVGSFEPLEIISEAAGAYVVPGEDALRAEIRKIEEEEKKLRAEKQRRIRFLKDLGG